MKHLQDYIQDEQTALFDRLGVFFAFSPEQFHKQKKEGVSYWSLSGGMICPKGNEKELVEELDRIYQNGIEKDLEENGKLAIIKRELANHEYCITYDITDTADALVGYPITNEEIQKVANCGRL